jgi:S-formylglutathione hydrolase FrmB
MAARVREETGIERAVEVRGHVVLERLRSRVLEGNAPGDPATRTVPIYLPPSYATSPSRRYPVAYVLAGFTGRGRAQLNDNAWNPPLDERMDGMIARGDCAEMILVMPDCFTRYGGSQYLNSTATGHYMDHVVEELVPWVDANYRTMQAREHRGVIGKSSGGYGALALAMLAPQAFGAAVCHSGDMYFDYCYRVDIPKFCTLVQQAGGLVAWLKAFEARRQKSADDMLAMNIVAMAAAYSPNPDAPLGIDLPVEIETGEFREDVWERWQARDPLVMAESHVPELRALSLLFFDCGTRDEWHLHHGARMLARRLTALKVPHEHQEFDDGHRNVQYRYEVSMPKLAKALGAR